MTVKRQLTLHVDPDIAAAIEAEGKRRGLNLSRAANDALRRALVDEAGDGLANTVKARLGSTQEDHDSLNLVGAMRPGDLDHDMADAAGAALNENALSGLYAERSPLCWNYRNIAVILAGHRRLLAKRAADERWFNCRASRHGRFDGCSRNSAHGFANPRKHL